MNEFYKRIPGWFDFEDIYRDAVARAGDGAHFVEVGCWFGRSTCFLATEIRNSGKRIRLDAVDWWKDGLEQTDEHRALTAKYGSFFDAFLGLMAEAGVADIVRPFRAESLAAVHFYPAASLDFVWIDADHTYGEVLADLTAWHPKVKPGGTLAGHDYHPSEPGVVQAVRDFFRGDFRVVGNSWIAGKA